MAINDERRSLPTPLVTRLRSAWLALLGRTEAMTGASIVPAAGRAIAEPQALLIEQLIDGFPEAAIVLDREGRVIAFNEMAISIAPALRRGEPALIALRMPELVDAIRRAIRRHEPQRVEFFERVPLDRWFEAFVTPVTLTLGAGGTADILVMTFNDLTPLRRVEEMRADFIANASHELRTPLAALLGFIETLQGPAKDDPVARDKFLGIMQGQATRMARLIDDLLSLSRIELNAHLQPSTPVDLAPIVRQVVDGLQMLARDRGVEIKVALPPDTLTVLGDRDELIRALENLIENALKYGAAGKRVDVTVAPGTNARRPAGSARGGTRLWTGYFARASSAADRAILPGGCRRQPRAGRHRIGSRAGQTCPQPAWRPPHHREHAGRGCDLHDAYTAARCRFRAYRRIGTGFIDLQCHLSVTEAL